MATAREKVLGGHRGQGTGLQPDWHGRPEADSKGRRTKLSVKRYLPTRSETFFQSYELRFHDELTVLDALSEIKNTQDGTLTFRWSCRMGICGSCGAMVNGKPVLMCQTYVKDLAHPVRVEPLRNFPIIKDLVCEIDDAFEKMKSVNPYIERMKSKSIEDGEYEQTPAQLEKLKQTSQCIKCMLCYSACPVYGLDKNFVGPAAGALAYRYQADSREDKESKSRRMDSVVGKKGVWNCSFIGECSAVCPKRVDPALALQRLKLMGALHLAKKIISNK